MTERLTAKELVERQRAEQDAFLLEQASRLNDVNYNWWLPKHFQTRGSKYNQGLVFDKCLTGETLDVKVLTPRGEIVVLRRNSGLVWEVDDEGETYLYLSDSLIKLESQVNKTLAVVEASAPRNETTVPGIALSS